MHIRRTAAEGRAVVEEDLRTTLFFLPKAAAGPGPGAGATSGIATAVSRRRQGEGEETGAILRKDTAAVLLRVAELVTHHTGEIRTITETRLATTGGTVVVTVSADGTAKCHGADTKVTRSEIGLTTHVTGLADSAFSRNDASYRKRQRDQDQEPSQVPLPRNHGDGKEGKRPVLSAERTPPRYFLASQNS